MKFYNKMGKLMCHLSYFTAIIIFFYRKAATTERFAIKYLFSSSLRAYVTVYEPSSCHHNWFLRLDSSTVHYCGQGPLVKPSPLNQLSTKYLNGQTIHLILRDTPYFTTVGDLFMGAYLPQLEYTDIVVVIVPYVGNRIHDRRLTMERDLQYAWSAVKNIKCVVTPSRFFKIVVDRHRFVHEVHLIRLDVTSELFNFLPVDARSLKDSMDVRLFGIVEKRYPPFPFLFAYFPGSVVERLARFKNRTPRYILHGRVVQAGTAKILAEIASYSNLTFKMVPLQDGLHYEDCSRIKVGCLVCAFQANHWAAIVKTSDESITFFLPAEPKICLHGIIAPFNVGVWVCIFVTLAALYCSYKAQKVYSTIGFMEIYRPLVLQSIPTLPTKLRWSVLVCILSSFFITQAFLANFASFTVAPTTAEIQSTLVDLINSGYKFIEKETNGIIRALVARFGTGRNHRDTLKLLTKAFSTRNDSTDSKKVVEMVLSLGREDYKVIFPRHRKRNFHILREELWLAPVVWAFKPLNLESNVRAFKLLTSSGIFHFLDSLTEDYVIDIPGFNIPPRAFRNLWLKDFHNQLFMAEIPTLRYAIHKSACILYAIGITLAMLVFIREIWKTDGKK